MLILIWSFFSCRGDLWTYFVLRVCLSFPILMWILTPSVSCTHSLSLHLLFYQTANYILSIRLCGLSLQSNKTSISHVKEHFIEWVSRGDLHGVVVIMSLVLRIRSASGAHYHSWHCSSLPRRVAPSGRIVKKTWNNLATTITEQASDNRGQRGYGSVVWGRLCREYQCGSSQEVHPPPRKQQFDRII